MSKIGINNFEEAAEDGSKDVSFSCGKWRMSRKHVGKL
jgi:hypothetical protein